MMVSSDGGYTFIPAIFDSATNTVTVPQGDIVEFGVDVLVTGNPNPAGGLTGGTPGDASTYNRARQNQPANLGLASYGFGMTDSKASVAYVDDSYGPGAGGTTTSESGAGIEYWDVFEPGGVDDSGGGILPTEPESAFVNAAAKSSMGTLAVNTELFGVGTRTAAELLNSLYIQTNVAGTAVFTPTDQVGPGNLALIEYASSGTTTTLSAFPRYASYTVVADDGNIVNNLPALTVVVQEQVPEPATAATLLIGASGLVLGRPKRNA